eukprot:6176688-Pleurochrysis_carterae.AAC.2
MASRKKEGKVERDGGRGTLRAVSEEKFCASKLSDECTQIDISRVDLNDCDQCEVTGGGDHQVPKRSQHRKTPDRERSDENLLAQGDDEVRELLAPSCSSLMANEIQMRRQGQPPQISLCLPHSSRLLRSESGKGAERKEKGVWERRKSTARGRRWKMGGGKRNEEGREIRGRLHGRQRGSRGEAEWTDARVWARSKSGGERMRRRARGERAAAAESKRVRDLLRMSVRDLLRMSVRIGAGASGVSGPSNSTTSLCFPACARRSDSANYLSNARLESRGYVRGGRCDGLSERTVARLRAVWLLRCRAAGSADFESSSRT